MPILLSSGSGPAGTRSGGSCWAGPVEIQSLGERYGTVGTYQDQALIQDIRYARDYWPQNPEGPLIPVDMEWFAAVDAPEGPSPPG